MGNAKEPHHSPEAETEVDGTGKTLTATIESTGEGIVDEPTELAKGSHRRPDELALADAPTLASEGGGQGQAHRAVREGERLGRLEIGKTLGEGAFGIVVAAYDPELKRRLAVKILKPDVFGSAGGKEAQARLLREARAMARVDHANVVSVHDIGMLDGQVFIAMQFVEGNLRTWLAEETRSWSAIVECFVQAGQGLAAAHAVGLVHRDIKPDNVLVSKNGEVRVADFGLVSISNLAERAASTEFETAPQSSDNLDITRAGALMGTALYMAPEQHLGKEATPASDQFAFCVALYWALYQRQPFEGKDYKSLRAEVLAGHLKPPPTTASAPRWLYAILRKGMAVDPAQRHASMPALLSLLQRDRAGQRRKWLAVGGAITLGAALAAYGLQSSAANNPCQRQADKLAGIWDAAARQRLEATFASKSRAGRFALLAQSVDGYAQDWVSVRTRVCEATHLFGEQSDQMLDQRMLCLDQRLNYLREFLGHVAQAQRVEILDTALTVASDLPALEACTSQLLSSSPVAMPDDRAQQASIASLETSIDAAQALFDLGQQAASESLLRDKLELGAGYAPSLAKANLLLGKARADLGHLEEAEAALQAAIEQGTTAADDLLVARAWLALMHLYGVERENYSEAHRMGELARLSLLRGQAGAFEMASIDKAFATILLREGKTAEAIARLREALPRYQEHASKPELARLLASLGEAMAADFKQAEAVDYYRLALAHIESSLGKDHPENLYVLNNLAVVLKDMGDIEGARAALDQSLHAIESNYGPENRDLVTVLINLGNIVRRQGDMAEAKKIFERAIRVGQVSMEADHPSVTKAMMNLAIVYAGNGENALATKTFREVLVRTEKSFTEDHPDRAMALNNLGESLELEGNYAEALSYVQAAVDMKGRLYGIDHPRQASSIVTLASVYKGLGNDEQAIAHYARALAIYQQAVGDSHALTIGVESELGRLYESMGTAKKALRLLRKAIEGRGDDDSLAQAEDRFALARALWKLSQHSEAESIIESLAARSGEGKAELEFAERLRLWQASR